MCISQGNAAARFHINRHLDEIISEIDPKYYILDRLVEAGVISKSDCDSVLQQSRRTGRARLLSELALGSKHPDGCLLFLKSLQRDHQWLFNEISENPDPAKSPRTSNEFNILLLGETGTGKSTWINAFYAYMKYSTMKEAQKVKDKNWPIPISFDYTDEDYKITHVSIGEDRNEAITTGASSTQLPVTYLFSKEDMAVRLIDTPGIGDTRGIDKDKENCQLILNHIASFDALHAICILIKPNHARLTAGFTYCVKELLSNLHRDACNNVVFCFTDARSCSFRGGDSIVALGELLKLYCGLALERENTFYVDNEAVRFLAAKQRGVVISRDEEKLFSKSWEKTADEMTNHLLGRVKMLPPHPVKILLSVVNARRMIVELDRPLTEIRENIDRNLRLIEEENENIVGLELRDMSDDGKLQYLKRLHTAQIEIEVVPLERPLRVCTSGKCVDEVTRDKVTETVHRCSKVKKYRWFNAIRAECKRCGCPRNEHAEIKYKIIRIRKETKSFEAASTDEFKSEQLIEEHLRKLTLTTGELEEEKKLIMQSSVKFAVFLLKNAVVPYNDSVTGFLDMWIEERKGDFKNSQDLRQFREKHERPAHRALRKRRVDQYDRRAQAARLRRSQGSPPRHHPQEAGLAHVRKLVRKRGGRRGHGAREGLDMLMLE